MLKAHLFRQDYNHFVSFDFDEGNEQSKVTVCAADVHVETSIHATWRDQEQ